MVTRHLLRQDPQVLVLGEIRDDETARLAIRAALTGHLVIPTLHTGSCRGVFERLLVMCPDPSAVATATGRVLALGPAVWPASRRWLRWKLPGFREAQLAQLAAALHLVLARGTPLDEVLALAAELANHSPAGRERGVGANGWPPARDARPNSPPARASSGACLSG